MNVHSLTATLDSFIKFDQCSEADAELLIVGAKPIEISRYPNLKYIFKCGIGVDNIEAIDTDGIEVIMPSKDTAECIYEEVSNFTIHLILKSIYSTLGNVYPSWSKKIRDYSVEKRILVVGHKGNIGWRVYSKASKLFREVLTYDIDSKESYQELSRSADIITYHVPLTDTTRNLIDVSLFKEDVTIINTSRAGIIDESVLKDFLIRNPKATAYFDVFWKEPYTGELLDLKNFYATPHIASNSSGFLNGLYSDLTKFLKRVEK